jgi:hypothetical protein
LACPILVDCNRPAGVSGVLVHAALKLVSRFRFQHTHLNSNSNRLASRPTYRTRRKPALRFHQPNTFSILHRIELNSRLARTADAACWNQMGD